MLFLLLWLMESYYMRQTHAASLGGTNLKGQNTLPQNQLKQTPIFFTSLSQSLVHATSSTNPDFYKP